MDHKTCVKRHIWKFWIWWPFLTWPWPWPGLNMKQFHSLVPSPGPWEYIWKVLGETCYVWGHYGLQPENTRFWHLTWPWPDTWPQFWIFESGLEASRRDLSNAASSVSLRPSVFEIAGGVGSDPPRLWWVQKQPRRWWVKNVFVSAHCASFFQTGHFETHAVDDAFVLFVVTVFVLCI